ncbi:MAG: ATP-binding protein [Mycoplasmataceae bacterium]|nr:ATP-binding protein [Mycoplasmataceae bacterium]
MNEIVRQKYIDELDLFFNKKVIKVITGIRRVGKSTLLEQYKIHLLKENKITTNQMFSFDFNDIKLRKLSYEQLYDLIIAQANSEKTNYLFLDEVQEIKNFEHCIISLFENKQYKFDIYITGSNSKMFSSKLATLFTGRNVEIKVYPLSFKEYFEFVKMNYNIHDKYQVFEKYLKYGGLPICLDSFNQPLAIETKLLSLINDAIEKDIFSRHKVENVNEFKKILKYLIVNIGQPISTTNIANTIKSNNKSIVSAKTIDRYIDWISEAILIYRCYFYSFSTKSILNTAGKVYAADTGIKNSMLNFEINNRGSLLENIVYLELLRRKNKTIFVGKTKQNKEIDFIVENGSIKVYYQICENFSETTTQEREISSFSSVKDSYQKYILILYGEEKTTKNGIKIINIIDWLLNEEN